MHPAHGPILNPRPTAGARAAIALLALTPLLTAACGGASGPTRVGVQHHTGGQAAALVLRGPDVLEYERDPATTPEWERFEFARNDAAASVKAAGPMLATRAWPEPAPPRERRVRFHYWRQ